MLLHLCHTESAAVKCLVSNVGGSSCPERTETNDSHCVQQPLQNSERISQGGGWLEIGEASLAMQAPKTECQLPSQSTGPMVIGMSERTRWASRTA